MKIINFLIVSEVWIVIEWKNEISIKIIGFFIQYIFFRNEQYFGDSKWILNMQKMFEKNIYSFLMTKKNIFLDKNTVFSWKKKLFMKNV